MTSIQHLDPDEDIQPLSEDNDPPFSLPDSPSDDANDDTFDRQTSGGQLDPTHPVTEADGNADDHEAYDEGLSGAFEAEEPKDSAVVDYNPDQDQRKQEDV